MTPKVGDLVIHHGVVHEIKRLNPRARINRDTGAAETVETVVFENERYHVVALLEDVKWSEEDQAWYLPGRVLSRDERTLLQAISGAWPPATSHLTMRKVLDVSPGTFKDTVDLGILKDVVKARRLKQEVGESAEDYDTRAATYAGAMLDHCEELRAARKTRKEELTSG